METNVGKLTKLGLYISFGISGIFSSIVVEESVNREGGGGREDFNPKSANTKISNLLDIIREENLVRYEYDKSDKVIEGSPKIN